MPSVAPVPTTKQVDTVIVGNGPSALVLSYILNGHIPRYVGRHSDEHLHLALANGEDLLHFDSSLYDHLRSSLKYSSQALPVNVLLDTLIRPDGDVTTESNTCVEWSYEPERAVDHVVIGESAKAGGQWAENPVIASWNIGTLSYAEQLSLPGYSFAEYWLETRGEPLPELVRPSRTDVAQYLAAYPRAVGISKNLALAQKVYGVSRVPSGFYVASHDLRCKHLVLASGTFNINLPPPRSLAPLASLRDGDGDGTVLVIGSGFTAADIIISTSAHRKIIHVYNWDPDNKPSPLKGCHSQAYPEYAWIYRQMRIASIGRSGDEKSRQGLKSKYAKARVISTLPRFSQRDWSSTYVGYPNGHPAVVHDGHPVNGYESASGGSPENPSSTAKVAISMPDLPFPDIHNVDTLQYAAGRRGSLTYLSSSLLSEVLSIPEDGDVQPPMLPKLVRLSSYTSTTAPDPDPWTGESETQPASPASPAPSNGTANTGQSRDLSSRKNELYGGVNTTVSGNTLRAKIEETDSIEMAKDTFVIGSLTGDSLVRYALGSCCAAAGAILDRCGPRITSDQEGGQSRSLETQSSHDKSHIKATNGSADPCPSHCTGKDFHSLEHSTSPSTSDTRRT